MTPVMSEQTLASRLKTETAELHESMHELMGRLAPFARRDRYVRFVAAQYVFQCQVNALADQPALHAMIPDLAQRTRVDAARQDLIDLDADLSVRCRTWLRDAAATTGAGEAGASSADAAPGRDAFPARALGWLYVSEGSTLGAAFLFKEAQTALNLSADFGARNLAASPAGRAQAWRAFVAALDARDLPRGHADQVVDGAREAFAFFGRTLRDAFSDAAPGASTAAPH
ncbi:MAG: biliverdin-producing heme oxygenase [Comamonadaceae bacterium]|nr:MAG: biliverdin-producing heme oxygenase [Comamonadaceae bacterium]